MIVNKQFRFEMAHRVADAYTKECRGLHGHSYMVEIAIGDKNGMHGDMVVDFKLLKDIVYPVIESMDHAIMVWDNDEFLVKIAHTLNDKIVIVPFNPTAENMAKWIYETIAPMFGNFVLKSVTVHETVTAYAKYCDYDYNFDKINDRLFIKKTKEQTIGDILGQYNKL